MKGPKSQITNATARHGVPCLFYRLLVDYCVGVDSFQEVAEVRVVREEIHFVPKDRTCFPFVQPGQPHQPPRPWPHNRGAYFSSITCAQQRAYHCAATQHFSAVRCASANCCLRLFIAGQHERLSLELHAHHSSASCFVGHVARRFASPALTYASSPREPTIWSSTVIGRCEARVNISRRIHEIHPASFDPYRCPAWRSTRFGWRRSGGEARLAQSAAASHPREAVRAAGIGVVDFTDRSLSRLVLRRCAQAWREEAARWSLLLGVETPCSCAPPSCPLHASRQACLSAILNAS